MFEVSFGGEGGGIQNWVSQIFSSKLKMDKLYSFSRFRQPDGVRIQGSIEIPNKQDIQELNPRKILKETSIFYQQSLAPQIGK